MDKQDLLSYLDSYLAHDQFSMDSSANGLQVDTSKKDISTIGYAVDVTTYIIEKAAEKGVDMLLTHHGLFRGQEQVITGPHYERIKLLMQHDIAVYSSHLPLDAHAIVGNNYGLMAARQRIFALGKDVQTVPFGDYKGVLIGCAIQSHTPIPVAAIITPYAETMGLQKKFYNFGQQETISSIAIVSGGAGDSVREAAQKNIDLFITGEMVHHQITLAKELGQSILLGGHYETEKIGPKLLAHHLQKQWPELDTFYIDEKY